MISKKILQFFLATFLLGLNFVYAQLNTNQSKTLNEYLSKLPSEFVLAENKPQKYSVTSTMHNRNIQGNTLNNILITAEYTRGLEDSFMRWNNVRIGAAPDSETPASEGKLLEYMEDFSYKMSEDIIKEEFYQNFPNDDTRHLIKTLIWDAALFDPFFWDHLDKLELNKFYRVSDLEDFKVQMGNWGSIKMKNLKFKWTGISKMNKETCALIQYESFFNPVLSMTNTMTIQGRSLYWGNFWISLEDKQIEYFTLNEDVVMEMTLTGNPEKRLLDIQREVIFEKID